MVYGLCDSGRHCGPWAGTLRDVRRPLRWYGVSGAERVVLEWFLDAMGRAPDELHTHVGLGRLPDLTGLDVSEDMRKVLVGRWPWRVDAAVRYGERWWLIECKDHGTHGAVGQLLYYWWAWCRDVEACPAMRAVLACLTCDPDIAAFAARVGVDVVCVGDA